MLRDSSLNDGKIIITIKRIRKEVARFESVEFFHIPRKLNQMENCLDNKAILLYCGNL
jgi:hypothetical protein